MNPESFVRHLSLKPTNHHQYGCKESYEVSYRAEPLGWLLRLNTDEWVWTRDMTWSDGQSLKFRREPCTAGLKAICNELDWRNGQRSFPPTPDQEIHDFKQYDPKQMESAPLSPAEQKIVDAFTKLIEIAYEGGKESASKEQDNGQKRGPLRPEDASGNAGPSQAAVQDREDTDEYSPDPDTPRKAGSVRPMASAPDTDKIVIPSYKRIKTPNGDRLEFDGWLSFDQP